MGEALRVAADFDPLCEACRANGRAVFGDDLWTDKRHEAFWAKVAVRGPRDCWLWTASKTPSGYGKFKIGRAMPGAHRTAWQVWHGQRVPEGLELDHLCAVPHCVNPLHLEPVTGYENWRRGRSTSRANADKRTCKNGHLLTGANVYVERRPNGREGRHCKTCRDARMRDYYRTRPRARKPKPSEEVLRDLVESGYTWRELSLEYGVSDVAVRKWAIGYGIDVKRGRGNRV